MLYSNAINLANRQIETRSETIAETIALSHHSLLNSTDCSVIAIPIHNIITASQMYLFIKGTLGLVNNFPNSKLFIIAPTNTLCYQVFSRLKHFNCIFQTKKYIQLVKIIDTIGATKMFYALDIEWQLDMIKKYPDTKAEFILKQSDLVYSTMTINHVINPILISHCNSSHLISHVVKNIKQNPIILGDSFNKNIKYPQLTHTGFQIEKGIYNRSQNINTTISMAIGLMQQCQYLKIDKELNVFDVIRSML